MVKIRNKNNKQIVSLSLSIFILLLEVKKMHQNALKQL